MLALQGRGVAVQNLTATGYGEADPIADNATEEGREANRRIEFSVVSPVSLKPTPVDAPGAG